MAGNTGAQMGGWFNREINSLADIQGLRMRISGLGGEVFQRTGGVPVALPGAELFTSLATGAIDATEWNGPFNDMAFGLHEAARYYYYPGWHEPSGNLECLISAEAWDSLSPHLQAVVTTACLAETEFVTTEFAARNEQALVTLREEHGIVPRRFPDSVLRELQANAAIVMDELAQADATVGRVYASYSRYADAIGGWLDISNGFFRGA
jgi:TRAP-type mannitol/chloroaromatic compound transport system substrate-binding protein